MIDRWHREERALRESFDRLPDDDLEATAPGEGMLSRWRCLFYLVNHGMQQFSEAAVLLSRLGHSPGEIGFLEFCSTRSRGGGSGRRGPDVGCERAGSR